MGHTRLGSIPKSAKWTAIIAEVTGQAGGPHLVPWIHAQAEVAEPGVPLEAPRDVASIAAKTLAATETALAKSVDDFGLRYTFYLLARVALAARSQGWEQELRQLGLDLAESASVFDLTAELQSAIDRRTSAQGQSTDVTEIAQAAAGEAIASLAGPSAATLFGRGREELRVALRHFSTKQGFGRLGQRFFARFVARFLNFYLSRITAASIGSRKLPQVGDLSRFNAALDNHCEQSARIVRDFCAEWYSKTEFQEGIDVNNTSRFLAVALQKLAAELRSQRAET